MGTLIYGLGRARMIVGIDDVYLPANVGWLQWPGRSSLFSIPSPVLIAAAIGAGVFVFLRLTKAGRFVYAIGDNFHAARQGGIAVRHVLVVQYLTAGFLAYAAGLVMATSVSAMNTRIVNSNLIYDVILVVVLGGVGLSGGRGNVRNVVVGILLNGMIILDVPYTVQNLIKSLILLAAIVADSLVNPRDEQTAQQGDI